MHLELGAGLYSSHRPRAKAMPGIYLDPNPIETNMFYALFKLVSVMAFTVTSLLKRKEKKKEKLIHFFFWYVFTQSLLLRD